eukprot:jgi/Chrzof1/1535/Cz10g11150.t1
MAVSDISSEFVNSSQTLSLKGTLQFRRTSTSLITAQFNKVHIKDEESSQSMPMMPDRLDSQLTAQRSQSLTRGLTVDTTRYPSQDLSMACTPDYATPVEQQFHVDYDVGTQQDQQRSPAKSPVRHIKRPRRLAGLEDQSEVTSQPSQCSGRSAGEPSTSQTTTSGCRMPPPCPRPKSRFAKGPTSPCSYKNDFLRGPEHSSSQLMRQDSFGKSHKPFPAVTVLNMQFKNIKEIGSGNFSRVYQATARLDGLDYAIKKTKEPISKESDRAKWLQEVQALAVAQAHPHIVQYYWSWAENDLHGDFLYIQLELCQDSLADQAKARKAPWNESELLLIMKQMAAALCHLHSKGIVHMDLKPDNIYQCSDGNYKLGDFGLATMKHGHWRVSEGDARYLSPELLKGDTRHLDKADVFALGATLYELATGTALPSSGLQYEKIRKGKLALLPNLSTLFQSMLKSLMAEDPAQRPSPKMILKSSLCGKASLNLTAKRMSV